MKAFIFFIFAILAVDHAIGQQGESTVPTYKCDFCKDIMTEVKKEIEKNKTDEEIIQTASQVR